MEIVIETHKYTQETQGDNMLAGVQVIGALFGVIMIYLSYMYYKRNAYSWRSMWLWNIVWFGFILIILFPQTVYGVMEAVEIERTADFIVMTGFVLYAIIIFYLYIHVKNTGAKVEQLVRKMAIDNVNKKTQEKKSARKSLAKR